MEQEQKLFAFKLANKKSQENAPAKDGKWQARNGVSIAGCSDYIRPGNLRIITAPFNYDNGAFC